MTLPCVASGIVGAIALGLGRALGETIAVAMVCGVALGTLPTNLYGAMITIAANIVQNLDTAITDPMDVSAFAELALVLMVIHAAGQPGRDASGAAGFRHRLSRRQRTIAMSETTGARKGADRGEWPAVHASRKIANVCYWIARCIALAVVVGPALWLVGGVLAHAVPHWQWSVITTNTTGETGGLKQAILGTLVITLGVLIIGDGISILAGLYLAEFAVGRLRTVLRSGYEILSGIPSVVLGLVGYLVRVSEHGLDWKYGLLPAVLVMSVIIIPYITKATETSLLQVPAAYREGADALGITPLWTLRKIVFKSALPGIVTGLLVAITISVGETAPLLYTAGWSDFAPSLQLTGQPIAFLTYPVFTFFNLPDQGAKILAYATRIYRLEVALTVIGQITGQNPPFILGTTFELWPLGYTEAEYALSGVASAYERSGSGVKAAGRAEFSTRLLVRRPADAAAFNGTVWVEWLNVSGGADTAAEWLMAHTELMRSGAAWVGVSAQQLGVCGGTGLMGFASPGLAGLDPERYGSLHHPGDRFSYDIFSLAGDAVRRGTGTIMEDLAVGRVLAMGESQSAFRLSTYVNEVDAAAVVYDGFLVHARGGSIAPLDDEGSGSPRDGDPVPFRDDPRVPVLCVEAETDLVTLGYHGARRDDAERLVTWEIAGTSHADVYTLMAGAVDTGWIPAAELAPLWRPVTDLRAGKVDKPVNAGAQHYVLNAAMSWLDRWARDGARPPAASRLQMRDGRFVTDEVGNVLGGVRTPHVDVPVAVLSGLGNSGGPVAFLAGTTTPLGTDALRACYPTPAAYLEQFKEATARAVAAGFLLGADADEITAIAALNSPTW